MAVPYTMFVDESGQRELGPGTGKYYVCAGTVLRSAHANEIRAEMAGLKKAFFGSPDVEVKSNWIRQPQEAKSHYLVPCKITARRLSAFVAAFYRWIKATDILFLAGVVDKKQLVKQYRTPYYPSGLAYQILLQRYQKRLGTVKGVGDVIMDRVGGASPKHKKWQGLLGKQHKKLKKNGCNLTGLEFSRVKGTLTFVDSRKEPILQISDLCAYNVFRQFRDHGAVWDDPSAKKLPVYDFFNRMLPRFDQSRAGVFAGYGVAKMPRYAKHRWLA